MRRPLSTTARRSSSARKSVTNLGNAHGRLSLYEKAIGYQSQALAVYDDVWAGLKTDDRRITFADYEYMFYSRDLQQAHVALGQPALALECAERVRGRGHSASAQAGSFDFIPTILWVFLFKATPSPLHLLPFPSCSLLQFSSHHFSSHHFSFVSLQFVSLQFVSLHFTSHRFYQFTSLYFTSVPLHFNSLHISSLHFTSLQFTSLQFHFTSHHSL